MVYMENEKKEKSLINKILGNIFLIIFFGYIAGIIYVFVSVASSTGDVINGFGTAFIASIPLLILLFAVWVSN